MAARNRPRYVRGFVNIYLKSPDTEKKWKSIVKNFGELWNLPNITGAISDFGVSTAISNTIGIFRCWCKLNFGPLRGQVKSCHFSERRHCTKNDGEH